MSTHKTHFEAPRAEAFLNKYYGSIHIRAELVGAGEESQAFYFSFNDEDYVLRVSRHGKLEYLKDQIARDEFSSIRLPIPEVIEIGEVDDRLSFAITRRAVGNTLDKLSEEEVEALDLRIIEVLDEIHHLKTPGEGFGGVGPK